LHRQQEEFLPDLPQEVEDVALILETSAEIQKPAAQASFETLSLFLMHYQQFFPNWMGDCRINNLAVKVIAKLKEKQISSGLGVVPFTRRFFGGQYPSEETASIFKLLLDHFEGKLIQLLATASLQEKITRAAIRGLYHLRKMNPAHPLRLKELLPREAPSYP